MNSTKFNFIDNIETAIGLVLVTIVKTVIGRGLRYIILFVPHYIWRNYPGYYTEYNAIKIRNIASKSYNLRCDGDLTYSCVGKNSFITDLIKEQGGVTSWIDYKFNFIFVSLAY